MIGPAPARGRPRQRPTVVATPQAPMNATPMTPDLAFNTAVSFMTNTNWQSYVPETTMSYFVQMAGA